jgi:hypothetical protein
MGSCASNLGPNERRKRWMAAGLAIASGIVLAIASDDTSVLPRIGIVVSMLVAAVCVMQARAQTCVLLAYTGRRNLDGGNERVRDLDQRRELVRSANLVMVKALALAFVGMLVLALV